MSGERSEYRRIVLGGLPTGIVTLLFTDIEGSTKLWERHSDQMRDALARHDEICRDEISRHNGVVFKTVGDAICSAFALPGDALAAAVAVQRAMHGYTWPPDIGEIRVRMALHSGECTERDGDYFGPTVNRVARLSSLAYGEQILVSAATAALLRDAHDGVELRSLGLHRLKDLAQQEPTFQVVAAGLRADFPALASLDSRPNNLPSQISSFVGREHELREVDALVQQSRLLTIVGPGGIGKTRLALQAAADVFGERYAGGAWFVDLAALRDPDSIPGTVASVLNVRELPSEPIDATLFAHLGDRQVLLILDNAEHLLAGVAAFAKLALAKCAGVTMLVTSREPLHVAGEKLYRLGSLTDATGLFLERARAAAPSARFGEFAPDDVAALCSQLEGIPLAIELACARLSSMPLEQLRRRLTSGLTLASKDSTEVSRHRTLRETIRWSYDMLSPEEQTALEAISIFRGGCAAGGIAAVAIGVGRIDDVLDALVDKSLLQIDASKAGERYRVLEVVRDYAREQLVAKDGERAAKRLHADYYNELVSASRPPYLELDDDVPNLRAALEWLIANDAVVAGRFILAFAKYWRARGAVGEARTWIARALGMQFAQPRERAALLCLAATFATLQDALAESLAFSQEALEIYRAADDGGGTAHAVFRIAEATHRQGRFDEAEAMYREALDGFTFSQEARGQVLCLGNLGTIGLQRRDFNGASELLGEAIRRAKALGDARIAGDFEIAMGWVALQLADFSRARSTFESIFAQKAAAHDGYGECAARHGIAAVALREGRRAEALEQYVATLETARALQLQDYVVRALHGVAAVRALEGDPEAAARLVGLTERMSAETGRDLHDDIAYEIALEYLVAALPEARRAELQAEGCSLELGKVIEDLPQRHL
jgi:predicted ATPase/class 3 adenylate cyclase